MTGSNSTGKTTLLKHLSMIPLIQRHFDGFLYSNARSLIQDMGFESAGTMTPEQLREFQITYFRSKVQAEQQHRSYIADRSFVDVAAYWTVRDTRDQPIEDREYLVQPCKKESQKYDILFYLPFGQIVFEYNDHRSKDLDFHRAIDTQISRFLDEWQLNYVLINTGDLWERIHLVMKELSSLIRID